MGRRISKEFLHPSILEGVNDKIGNLDSLETDAKGNMVQAINELVEKLDNSAEIENGKELIANAVGEPLTAEESFDEMSNDINSLLSTFKTNMMNNGVTVESSDRFKSLIDKIATMVEEGSGKGIQIVSGTLQDYVANTDTFNFFVKDSSNYTYDYASYVEIKDLSFRPSFVFINAYNEEGGGYIHNYAIVNNFNNNQYNNENNKPSVITGCSDVSSIGSGEAATYMADEKVFVDDSTIHVPLEFWSNIGSNIDYLIIGVGEEDTTLRDSLASILENKGVDVTEEDDMASLITKVDEEFDNSISVIPGEEFILETVDIGQVFSYDDSEWYELPTWTDARYHTIRYNGSYRVTVHGTVDSNNGTWVRIKETDNNGNIIQVSDEVKIVYGTSLYNIDIQNVFKGNRLYIEIKSSSLDASISMTDFEVKMTLE